MGDEVMLRRAPAWHSYSSIRLPTRAQPCSNVAYTYVHYMRSLASIKDVCVAHGARTAARAAPNTPLRATQTPRRIDMA